MDAERGWVVSGKRVSDEGGCGYLFGNVTKCAEQASLELKISEKTKFQEGLSNIEVSHDGKGWT